MRIPLNCWIVAMWIWGASRMRAYAWIRRSLHLRGMVPHFGTAHRHAWRTLRVIEYLPPHRDLGTWRNMLILFDGTYRVWELRVHRVKRFRTLREAQEAKNNNDRTDHGRDRRGRSGND